MVFRNFLFFLQGGGVLVHEYMLRAWARSDDVSHLSLGSGSHSCIVVKGICTSFMHTVNNICCLGVNQPYKPCICNTPMSCGTHAGLGTF